MHIEVSGQGDEPLLMLHGWGMHGGVFRGVLPALEARFRVHRVDLPGHGLSSERELTELPALAAELAERLPTGLWLGWSLGGLIAQQVALQCPHRVQRLALIASTPKFVASEDWTTAMPIDVFNAFAADLAQDWRGTVKRFIALEVHGSDTERRDLRTLHQTMLRRPPPSPQALASGLAMLRSNDLRQELPDLKMPALWISGRRDRLVPSAASAAAAELCANGSHVEIRGAGHAPFMGHPNQFLSALLEFCQ